MYLIRGSRSTNSWTMVEVLSVDPSSTTINSQFEYVCASADLIESAMYFSALYAGMIMLTSWLDIAVKLRCGRLDSSAFATEDPPEPFQKRVQEMCIAIPNRAHALLSWHHQPASQLPLVATAGRRCVRTRGNQAQP